MLFRVLRPFRSDDGDLKMGDEVELPVNPRIERLQAQRYLTPIESAPSKPAAKSPPQKVK